MLTQDILKWNDSGEAGRRSPSSADGWMTKFVLQTIVAEQLEDATSREHYSLLLVISEWHGFLLALSICPPPRLEQGLSQVSNINATSDKF